MTGANKKISAEKYAIASSQVSQEIISLKKTMEIDDKSMGEILLGIAMHQLKGSMDKNVLNLVLDGLKQ